MTCGCAARYVTNFGLFRYKNVWRFNILILEMSYAASAKKNRFTHEWLCSFFRNVKPDRARLLAARSFHGFSAFFHTLSEND